MTTRYHREHSHNCPQMIEKCLGYLEGDLEGADLEKVIELLDYCDCCKRCIEELRLTRDMLNQVPKPDMDDDLKNRLKDCLKKHG